MCAYLSEGRGKCLSHVPHAPSPVDFIECTHPQCKSRSASVTVRDPMGMIGTVSGHGTVDEGIPGTCVLEQMLQKR